MTVKNRKCLENYLTNNPNKLFFLNTAPAIFLAFSKVDFCVIVQNNKAQATNSGFIEDTEKTNFSMNVMVTFIVSFLGFARNNKKPTRKLNV